MYLEILKRKRIRPNFWCSEEYFEKAGWTENGLLDWLWVEDNAGKVMLPPVNTNGREKWRETIPSGIDFIWSDFLGYCIDNIADPEFLDHEYVYNPLDFRAMTGKHWMTFRKNSRKWPRDKKDVYYMRSRSPSSKEVGEVFRDWLEMFQDGETLYDPEVMSRYVFTGRDRIYLWHKDRLMGINVWDTNHKYVNYRYCIHRNEPFLNEYLRLLFYQNAQALVNDGGTLGSEGLKNFKDKLNPMFVREVRSWRLKIGN